MTRSLRHLAAAFLCATASPGFAAAAGAPTQQSPAAASARASAFLGDVSAFAASPDDEDMLVYRKRPGILADYDTFLIDPVLAYFRPDSEAIGLDPAKLAELTVYFRDQLVEQLEGGGYRVVDEPAPGRLRLRIAITDLRIARGAANAAGKVAGLATGVGLLLPNLDVGGAAIEAEAVDAASGERMLAVVDSDRGRRFLNVRGVQPTGDARAALKGWAKEFRARLDKAHGR